MLKANIPSLFTLCLIFTSVLGAKAQAPPIEWENNYGGGSVDAGRVIQQTNDGGYAVVGDSASFGQDRDVWVLKLNGSGNLQWEKGYGGDGNEVSRSIKQTDDGGYILACNSDSADGDVSGNNGNQDYWIVKLDSSGNIDWEKNYGGSMDDFATSIQQTEDGGYILAGISSSDDGDVSGNNGGKDYWLVKLDGSGNIDWNKNYGGNDPDEVGSVQQTNDKGYVLAGFSSSNGGDVSDNNGNDDFWIVKVDSSGNIQWENNYGGSSVDRATSVQQTDNGGYIVAGNSASSDGDVSENNGSYDYWLVKLDGAGNIEWEENYGGGAQDITHSVQQMDDGGYFLAGDTNAYLSPPSADGNYWVLKVDSSGNIDWEETYGGSENDRCPFGQITNDGGYIMAGRSASNDGDVSENNGQYDYWVVKLEGSGGTGTFEPGTSDQPSFYPNPTSGQVRINLGESAQEVHVIVRDLTGRTISSKTIEDASSFGMDIEGDPGMYLIVLRNGDGKKEVLKVVKK